MSNKENDTIVGVPIIVKPIRKPIPHRAIPVRIQHIPVAVRIAKQ